MPRLKLVLRGVKCHQAKCGTNSRIRLPITPSILRSLHSYWLSNDTGHGAPMLWAACFLCFFSLLRSGEICTPSDLSYDPSCHLSPGDISSNDPSHPSVLRVNIKQSKTDPFRHGVYIIVGATGESLCPVVAVLHYLTIRGMEAGPLFRFSDGRALTRQRFVSSICQALSDLGLDTSPYSGHSFRIGAATTAAAPGISDALIKTMGRWKSMAYATYIQTPVHQIALYLNSFSNCATSESGLLHSTVHVCLLLDHFVSRHIFPNPTHLLVIHMYCSHIFYYHSIVHALCLCYLNHV